MKQLQQTFRGLTILCAILCCTFPALAKGGTEKMQEQSSDLQNTAVGVHYNMQIDYPMFETEPVLTALITEIVEAKIQALNNIFAGFKTADIPPYAHHFDYAINYEKVYEDDTVISFMLSVYEYTGGAHGSTEHIPVTYSKKTKKLLSLKEIFPQPLPEDWLVRLSNEARRILLDQVQKGVFHSDTEWIAKGTEPEENNFSVFKVTENTVHIEFGQYQVAPYSEGMPEITVPITFFNK